MLPLLLSPQDTRQTRQAAEQDACGIEFRGHCFSAPIERLRFRCQQDDRVIAGRQAVPKIVEFVLVGRRDGDFASDFYPVRFERYVHAPRAAEDEFLDGGPIALAFRDALHKLLQVLVLVAPTPQGCFIGTMGGRSSAFGSS